MVLISGVWASAGLPDQTALGNAPSTDIGRIFCTEFSDVSWSKILVNAFATAQVTAQLFYSEFKGVWELWSNALGFIHMGIQLGLVSAWLCWFALPCGHPNSVQAQALPALTASHSSARLCEMGLARRRDFLQPKQETLYFVGMGALITAFPANPAYISRDFSSVDHKKN